jgi:FAD synthetase
MTTKVMTFGTFDLFHPGHKYYLSEASNLGDYLITVVARDTTVEQVKGKKPRESEKIRLMKLQESWYTDEAILGSETDHYAVILEKKPDILCFGYDQQSFNDERLQYFLKKNNLYPEIIILPAFQPERWKSSKL